MRFLAYLAFQGKPYIGLQVQTKFYKEPKQPFKSVQGVLEGVLQTYFAQSIKVKYASRTDGGVSAFNFPIQFDVPHMDAYDSLNYDKYSPSIIEKAVNNNLKWQQEPIYMYGTKPVDDGFNVCNLVKSKYTINRCIRTYTYSVLHNLGSLHECAFLDQSWNFEQRLDSKQIVDLSSRMLGFRNFYYFTNEAADAYGFKRTVLGIDVREEPHRFIRDGVALTFTIEGIGFLRYQVRYMVGCIVKGHSTLLSTLDSSVNDHAARTGSKLRVRAPACGLTFTHIN